MKNVIKRTASLCLVMLWLILGAISQPVFAQEDDENFFEDVDKMARVKAQLYPEEIEMISDYADDIKQFNDNLLQRQLDAYERFRNTTLFKPEKSELESNISGVFAKEMLGVASGLMSKVIPGYDTAINLFTGISEELERAQKARSKNELINWVEKMRTEMVHSFTDSFTSTLRDSLLVEAASLEASDAERGEFLKEVQRFRRNKKKWLPRIEELELELYKTYLDQLFSSNPKKGGYVLILLEEEYKKKPPHSIRLIAPRGKEIADKLGQLQALTDKNGSRSLYDSVLDLGIPVVVGQGWVAVSGGSLWTVQGPAKNYNDYYKRLQYAILFPWGSIHSHHKHYKNVAQYVKDNKLLFHSFKG